MGDADRRSRAGPKYHRGVHRLTAAVVTLAFALPLAGCGSKYTKQDFVARADGICTKALRDARSIAPPSAAGGKDAALAGYLSRLVPILESEQSQLRKLKRPGQTAAQSAGLDDYFKALAAQVTAIQRLLTAAGSGDSPGIAAAEGALRSDPIAAAAARYGLRACGTPGGTGV
jgi:hypothetical protein